MYNDIVAEGVPGTFCRDPAQAGRAEQRRLEKRAAARCAVERAAEPPRCANGDGGAMTVILRKQHAQDRIEGREPPRDWSDDDYAVVDETLIGRIYRQQVREAIKWLWFLQVMPAPPPNQGIADTLEEAKAALEARYAEVKRG
jgi:hypothetical protein